LFGVAATTPAGQSVRPTMPSVSVSLTPDKRDLRGAIFAGIHETVPAQAAERRKPSFLPGHIWVPTMCLRRRGRNPREPERIFAGRAAPRGFVARVTSVEPLESARGSDKVALNLKVVLGSEILRPQEDARALASTIAPAARRFAVSFDVQG
jgi:hypothetical protein